MNGMLGASWFKPPLWLGQNRLERGGRVLGSKWPIHSSVLGTKRQADVKAGQTLAIKKDLIVNQISCFQIIAF